MRADERPQRVILHLDMDAFYASVEVRDQPWLRGKPVIVGGSRERGVVSSASYEARRFGVHSAQPMAAARRLCPHGIFLPVRMARYREVSEEVFAIFHRFSPLMEPLSIDEAFLDVTASRRLFGSGRAIAAMVKRAVHEATGLTVSAGVAPNKFVAKIASDLHKPDGLTVVPPEAVEAFLDPLPIERMWGAGERTQALLKGMGIRTFADLRQACPRRLKRHLGAAGLQMQRLAAGLDPRQVVPVRTAKSVGHEETFARDIVEASQARRELLALACRVGRRLRRNRLQGRTVTLKVKYYDFRQITRSMTLERLTDDDHEIYAAACKLLAKTAAGRQPVRLLGISLSQLSGAEGAAQLDLFSGQDPRMRALYQALDSVRDRFGDSSVNPATLLEE